MSQQFSEQQQQLKDSFQLHMDAEARGDLETTMATMTDNPHVNHIPTMVGGIGYDSVQKFYTSLVPTGKFFPKDLEIESISQTIDEHQLVDEMIFKFTHTSEVGWMLPNIPPTGKRVEVPLVVIVGFKEGKVTHEHIYWDQASVLVQIGLLDPKHLPVHGIETAAKMKEIMMKK